MEDHLQSEIRNAIICDPSFVENFLTCDAQRLETILAQCRVSGAFDSDSGEWSLPPEITVERQLYRSILNVLNAIKGAVDASGSEFAEAMFQGLHSRAIPSDEPDTSAIKPDLVLFANTHQHWETVMMPIEVKSRATYIKAGIKQLSRYARAVFAQQLHRRHLYGLVVCVTEATFLRFDRAGILYSKPMDMLRDWKGFTRAFVSLMMLDRESFRYDVAFNPRVNQDGRLEYYVELPVSAFGDIPSESQAATTAPGPSAQAGETPVQSTWTMKVIERLCHRKTIRGRATIVPRLREVLLRVVPEPIQEAGEASSETQEVKPEKQPPEVEQLGDRQFVLKLIWRDPTRPSEGEVLKRLIGIFGLAQHVWYSDVFKTCHCRKLAMGSPAKCVDKTPERKNMLVNDHLEDIDIEIPEEDPNKPEPE